MEASPTPIPDPGSQPPIEPTLHRRHADQEDTQALSASPWNTGLEDWDSVVAEISKCFTEPSTPGGGAHGGESDLGSALPFGQERAGKPIPRLVPAPNPIRAPEAVYRRFGQHLLPFPHGPPARSLADSLFVAGFGVRRTLAVQAWEAPPVVPLADAESLADSFGPPFHQMCEVPTRQVERVYPSCPALRGGREIEADSPTTVCRTQHVCPAVGAPVSPPALNPSLSVPLFLP